MFDVAVQKLPLIQLPEIYKDLCVVDGLQGPKKQLSYTANNFLPC